MTMADPAHRMKVGCRKCHGTGELPEHATYEQLGVRIILGQDEHTLADECDVCEGKGKMPCPHPPRSRALEDADWCELCDGHAHEPGSLDCVDWQNYIGKPRTECEFGWVQRTCPHCGDKLEGSYTEAIAAYVEGGDEIVCANRRCIAIELGLEPDSDGNYPDPLECPDCAGAGFVYVERVTEDGKPAEGSEGRKVTWNSCSCCGTRPKQYGELFEHRFRTYSYGDDSTRGVGDAWFVVPALLRDTDGVFYKYLCVGEDGTGCLPEVLAQQEEIEHPPGLQGALREIAEGGDVDPDGELVANIFGWEVP